MIDGSESAALSTQPFGQGFRRLRTLYCRVQFDNVTMPFVAKATFLTEQQLVCTVPPRPSSIVFRASLSVNNYYPCNDTWGTICDGCIVYAEVCEAGSSWNTTVRKCDPCPPGRFFSGNNADATGKCNDCPGGSFGTLEGEMRPLCSNECAPGYFCVNGSSTQTECAAGRYSDRSKQNTCFDCAAGRYGSQKGEQNPNCTAVCPIGHYCLLGTNNPKKCPAGRYG